MRCVICARDELITLPHDLCRGCYVRELRNPTSVYALPATGRWRPLTAFVAKFYAARIREYWSWARECAHTAGLVSSRRREYFIAFALAIYTMLSVLEKLDFTVEEDVTLFDREFNLLHARILSHRHIIQNVNTERLVLSRELILAKAEHQEALTRYNEVQARAPAHESEFAFRVGPRPPKIIRIQRVKYGPARPVHPAIAELARILNKPATDSAFEALERRVREELSCSICIENFDKDRRRKIFNPCLHFVCSLCLIEMHDHAIRDMVVLKCPVCRADILGSFDWNSSL